MKKKTITPKVKSLLLKFSILIASLYFIYAKITEQHNYSIAFTQIHQVTTVQLTIQILLLLILMLINWAFEAIKWRKLVLKLETLSFLRALKSVFTGVTVSVFTPNRIGEFGGRIIYLKPENRLKAIMLNFVGTSAQLLVTLVTGLFAFFYYYIYCISFANPSSNATTVIKSSFFTIGLSLIFTTLLIVLYFNCSKLAQIDVFKKRLPRFQTYFEALAQSTQKELVLMLLISFFRYCVFTLQFYILLKFYQVPIDFIQGIAMIALTFFAITIIPTVSITEIGVRAFAALTFIGILSNNNAGIAMASLTLWIVNVAIPATIGSLFLLRVNLFARQHD